MSAVSRQAHTVGFSYSQLSIETSTSFACGLALAKFDNKAGKYERIGQVYGPLKYVSEKLRLQFDEPPTQEITIIYLSDGGLDIRHLACAGDIRTFIGTRVECCFPWFEYS